MTTETSPQARLARPEPEEPQRGPDVFDVRAAMATTIARFAPAASGKKLNLSLSVGEDEPLPVVGDERRFCQVLEHLVGNAVKFTDEGTVTVSLQDHRRPDRICELIVCVRDTGTGIRPEDHERIFANLGLRDDGDSSVRGGTGLGLSASRELVRLMGGALGVSSILGGGTTFILRVEMPLGAAADTGTGLNSGGCTAGDTGTTAACPAPFRPADDGGWTVLLVEDNPVNRAVAVHILAKAGCRIDVAENGAVALEMSRARRYDAIFMDLQMPVMDGLQATRAIRSQEGDGSRVPIIAVTANAMPGDRETCLTAGMDDYVPKPLRSSELVDALRRWCAGAPQPA